MLKGNGVVSCLILKKVLNHGLARPCHHLVLKNPENEGH